MPLTYDAIVYCRDRYDQKAGGDRMRGKVLSIQEESDQAILEACRSTGVPILEVPTGLAVAQRVQWAAQEVSRLGLGLAAV